MKKLVITSIGVTSFANFLGLLGVVTGAIKAIVLPVLALIGAGSLGDVDSAIKGVSAAVTSDISSIVTFGVGGWVGGAVYAWIANFVLGWTKGVTVGAK
jgi:hypothetical protein|tara:strand:- start:3813 stop:4109 length:297 start_codon:yes stop_codon:yes gene_type:complete